MEAGVGRQAGSGVLGAEVQEGLPFPSIPAVLLALSQEPQFQPLGLARPGAHITIPHLP